MEMKVAELKEELSARGETISGNKAWLRRRLHAAILRARLRDREPRARREETFTSTRAAAGLDPIVLCDFSLSGKAQADSIDD